MHAFVVVIHTPTLSNKRFEAYLRDTLYYIAEWSRY